MTTMTTPTTLRSHPFAEGTEVHAYLRVSETMTFDSLPPGQEPIESIFVAEGEVTFTSLPVGDYWAVGLVGGAYQYVAFRQQAEPLEFIQGPAGSDGAQGPPGPEGDKGDGAVVWEGPWNASATYAIGDAVSQGGASWVAKTAVPPNQQPNASPTYWDLMADKGASGAEGTGNPPGGAEGQAVTKLSAADFATAWTDVSKGYSSTDTFPGAPDTPGQIAFQAQDPSSGKSRPSFVHRGWRSLGTLQWSRWGSLLPSGGAVGEALTKLSTTDHDATWKPVKPVVVSSLPGSPAQGDEIYLRVGPIVGNPDYVLWHLRWETAYPEDRWEFLGGAPIRQRHTSGGDLVGASTNTALQVDNTWLETDLPANGIYDVTYVARDFGVTSGLSIATVEIQRMKGDTTYAAGVGKGECNHQAEYTSNASGSYVPFELRTYIDCRDKTATYSQPPTICPTMQRASGGTWSLRGNREIIVTPVYLIP